MRSCFVLSALMAVSTPTLVAAQTPNQPKTQTKTQKPASPYPAPAKWFANFHIGAQVGSEDMSRNSTFTLYDEPATFETAQKADGGFLLDVGGAARLYRDKYGIGLSFASFQSSGDSSFGGSLPHPLLFDQPRNFSGTASTEHKERAVHIQALWFIPYTDKIDFTVGIGPSFFSVEQGFARSISFSENPPDFTSVTIDSIEIVNIKESGVGFNIGATMSYAITRRYGADFGADVMLRYSHGSLKFALGEGQTVEAGAGGFQLGVGIGARF
ncbi:MAG: hypothetical protein WBC51_23300 [Vicinamibacterales bacterium]